MTLMPNRSRLLRFPEGTLLNYKYVLISARPAASPPAGLRTVAPLGRGGSSVVLLAHQVLFDGSGGPQIVPRAVKFYLLSPELARRSHPQEAQAANTRNLRNEITNLTRVDHANVLKVIDAGICERWGIPINYLVTEYVPGPTLRDVLACRRSRLPHRAEGAHRKLRADPTLILRIVLQLCAAVEYLHARDIYHCDIAPKNIFLHTGDECRPVLGDFTLSRQIGDWDDYDRILIGGAMRYAPPPVHRHFRRNDGPQEFATYATYWDMYGLAKSACELLDLAPAGIYLPWKNALLRYLGEAMLEEHAVTAKQLRRRIAKLL